MSFDTPGTRILRRSVAGMEGMHSKMFDPPTMSPDTPDVVNPTNPVPDVMAAAGYLSRNPVDPLHTLQMQLMHGMTLPTWDGQDMMFFLFRYPDGIGGAQSGTFPAPTIRMPRGVVFHAETAGSGPPPHTIHWHGHEPTPMNDGVGHCSMEVGHYVYQYQPNFIGSYFHHCHRNTVQHFEFGLYGFTIIDPPDAFFASIGGIGADGAVNLNTVPIGNGRPEPGFPLGRRRTAAALNPAFNPAFAIYGQDNFNELTAPDPEAANPNLPDWLKFPTDPHAHTVAYDVEALWVLAARDINWSNRAPNARATFPQAGSLPGVNDNFHGNAGGGVGPADFFAFNDYRSTHFYVTGVAIPDELGVHRIPGSGDVPHGVVVPPELMSGVSGVQVSVNAELNQNILLRVLNGAYNNARITFPIDIAIIAWDGRALGVPPYGNYNEPVFVPAGTPMEWSVARRFDCMIKSSVPVNSHATVEFIDTLRRDVRFTARIPINIGVTEVVPTFALSGTVRNAAGAPLPGVAVSASSISGGGSVTKTAITNTLGAYSVSGLTAGTYEVTPSFPGLSFDPMSLVVTLSTAGAIGVDFNATLVPAVTYAVSGMVAAAGGAGIAGVTMTLSGSAAATATTDASGNFAFPGLAPGNYVLTPSLAGMTFTPPSMPVAVFNADVIARNFTAATARVAGHTISGGVVRSNRKKTPLPGVTMTVLKKKNNAVVARTTTDGFGRYALIGLANGVYKVKPSLPGFKFDPIVKEVRVSGGNVTRLRFVATKVRSA